MESHAMLSRLVALAVALFCALAPVPAAAQGEIAGSWTPVSDEDISNDGLPVDYTAIPLNDEGRIRALSYSESQLSMIERQCQGWPQFYMVQGPFGLRIWSELEGTRGTVVSYTVGAWEDRPAMVIWMDGRPHPSQYAEHTRSGFTTGRWEGTTLVARTTHMKAGVLRKNGAPVSDRATLTTRFLRHGDLMTVLMVIEDPVYLAEPQVLTKTFRNSPQQVPAVGPPCISTYEGREPDEPTPHYAPEENPFVDEVTKKFGIPREAVLGFPETLYPEYRQKLRSTK